MASFDLAYPKTAANEGGYANVPGDRGGETYAGISRVHFPGWDGWFVVDKHKPLNWNQKIKDESLSRQVRQFYKKEFWDKIGGDKIQFQQVAERLYDFGVNAGAGMSIRQIQRVLKLPETGRISQALVEAINNPIKHLLK